MPWQYRRLCATKRTTFLALIALLSLVSLVNAQKKFDHQSHAVPGKDKIVRDYDGDGFAEVELNGELSHSHYFNPNKSSDTGRIVEYKWTENRLDTLIGTEAKVKYNFPVGKTTVTLFVRDQMNDTSTGTVTVTVTPSGAQGAYFYYFDMAAIIAKPWVLSMIDHSEHRPKFGTHVEKIDFASNKWPKLPESIVKGPFTIRVDTEYLALQDRNVELYVAISTGFASLHVNEKQVFWMHNKDDDMQIGKSKSVFLKKGKHSLQLRFYTSDPTDPVCILGSKEDVLTHVVPREQLSYHAHDVEPTVHEMTPLKSTLGGGGKMKIKGDGFYGWIDVWFGDIKGWNVNVKSPKEIILQIPKVAEAQDILVYVQSKTGVSNQISFSYNKAAPMPIKFKETYIKYHNNTKYPSKQFSSVAIGPDLQYYFGSLDSHVHVLSINHETLYVDNECKSVSMGMGRTVTGVSFNPGDTMVRVYISTNMFYWRDYYSVPDEIGWHNGKVQTLVWGKKKSDTCLILEKDLITGLPVSNHDHGVNNMVFDNYGNLYIQIGGSTNAGVSKPNDLVGGVKESELSSATIVAYLREPGFNGTIRYDQYKDPGTAKVLTLKKFIQGFAYGFRNSFGAVFHTSGNIFATDNGPNVGYGPTSTGCDTEGKEVWHPDSLVLVQRDTYFGYPNRARGIAGDERQCVYYPPDAEAKNGFSPALATLEASTNGVAEYTANCFEGQMKGDLLLSKYAVQGSGKLYRAQLDATKKALKKPVEELREFSGLSIAMNPYGELVMPRVQQLNIAVLTPDEEDSAGKGPKVTAVFPHRGPKYGFNWVIITGDRLSSNPKIEFGSKKCKVKKVDPKGKFVFCAVPQGSGAVHVTLKTDHGEYKSKEPDYYYMNY